MAKWQDAPLASATPSAGAKWQSAPLASPAQNASAPAVATPADPYFADLPIPGTIPSETQAPAAAPGDFNETAFAQGTSGVNEGIATALGAPVDLTNLALRGGAAGLKALGGPDIQLPVDAVGGRKTFTDIMAPAIRPESEDPGNQMVRRVGQEVGAAIVPAGGVVAKSAQPIKAAAQQAAVTLGSGAAAAAAQQIAPDNPYVEIAAQILGGGGVAAGMRGAGKLITPFPINAERQAANATMAAEGVDLSAGQMTGSKGLQYAEGELGGNAMANLSEKQMEQFTQAALSRAGISATRATPEVMDNAFTSIGKQFDDLASRNTLIPDQQLGTDLGAAVREYHGLVPESQRAPVVQNTLKDLVDAIKQNGNVSGDTYQALTSRLARLARTSKNDPQLSGALMDIRSSLDDAMARSIQANNPADFGAWQEVRTDYKNLLVLETAASRAGENAAMGIITPANLRGAVAAQGKRAYVRGQGDFNDLARSGVASMTPPPNSGTAARSAVRNAGMALPTVMGAALGGRGGDIGQAMLGAAAGAAVPKALGAVIMSGPGRRYLTNQALGAPIEVGQALTGPALGIGAQQINPGQRPNPELIRALRAQALN